MTLPARIDADRLTALARRAAVEADAGGERDRIPVEAPFAGEPVGDVPAGTPADAEAAIDRARSAQRSWAARSFSDRAAIFETVADRLLDERETLLDLIQLESGKSRTDAFTEVADASRTAAYYASTGEAVLADERRRGAVPLATSTRVTHHPVGVVGLVAPWNYPLVLTVSDAIPALLAGNAVVVKPAEETPFTALYAAELLDDCGLPADLFQVVTGDGATLGDPLVERVDYVGFTGSTEVGRELAASAGRHLRGCTLELGGKNPLLVLDDANVDRAARGAALASFSNAGQLCISTERLYVHTDVFDDFLDAFVGETRALRVDAGYDDAVDVGSMLSEAQLAKTERHVADAVERGASVVSGGRARPDRGPYVHELTILTDVTPEMTCYAEETFGPVVTVHEVEDEADAVGRANDSPYGLNASVWTEDEARGRDVARRLRCGTVNINDGFAAAWSSVDAPMGGMGDSGLGRRHGPEGILKYTESQTVASQRGPSLVAAPKSVPNGLWMRALTGGTRVLNRLDGWLPERLGGRR